MQAGSTVLYVRMISEIVASDVIDLRIEDALEDVLYFGSLRVCQWPWSISALRQESRFKRESTMIAFIVRQSHSSREAPTAQGSAKWPRVEHRLIVLLESRPFGCDVSIEE